MKSLKYIVIATLLFLTCCSNINTPRGVDEAGVWKVEHLYDDTSGKLTDEPCLSGEIEGGDYSGVLDLFLVEKTQINFKAQLSILYALKKSEEVDIESRKGNTDDIPVVSFSFAYKGNDENASYHPSYLWKPYNKWTGDIESKGTKPFTGVSRFYSNDADLLVFLGDDAEEIIRILTKGRETVVRAKCEDDGSHDEYTFTLPPETLKDFKEVLNGYRYHYAEYLTNNEQ